jgi:hypothetical protein
MADLPNVRGGAGHGLFGDLTAEELPSRPMAADPTIGYLLERYLSEHRATTDVDHLSYGGTVTVLDLLRGYLNRYGYHQLSETDRERFERAYFGEEDADAFASLFGPDELRAGIQPFLSEHLPDRVRADPSVIELARTVCADLIAWLDANLP